MTATNHPVRRWRKDNGKTLSALAGKVGVTPSHLSEIERGLNKPSNDLTAKLKAETGLPAEKINPALAGLLTVAEVGE
jgi:transcriptional regulator with XRE-family HTH domain